ncbi:MED14-domain-containing protein [Venturia nashicola]|uniref:Mediator of RNA polymerase II transcription subunit 14 n=1 Tax=Venturia nashicola TaxID=86259 RepID=A0A4Z1NHI5_9PEZI|nr:MED14-domain-containing protein [Venturia nashicola]TLD19447.1 MED14-domain-containing protein [Venturia nashicola]
MESNGVNGIGKQAASAGDARHPGKQKTLALTNGDTHSPYPTPNGVSPSSPVALLGSLPPELRHLDCGMSLGTLIERVAELCHRGVEDVVLSLEKRPLPMANGVPPYTGNKPDVNQQKKKELMETVNKHRTRFVKLMVLIQWSEQAGKQMGQMIDIKTWLHELQQCYDNAGKELAVMKRALQPLKIRSPDMETALAVLSTGKVPWMTDIGFLPSPPLKARRMLKVLHTLDTMLNIRLVVHENLIPQLRNYRIANGRATFSFASEFELDVYITGEDSALPFYFLDVRFLFHPAPQIADGFLRNEIEFKLNAILAENGLRGACDFIHSFILTHKISVLKRQAIELSRGNWASSLHIEQVHRVLVVQYWTESPQPKSWLEIGIDSGRKGVRRLASDKDAITSFLKVRWMLNGKEVPDTTIPIGLKELSFEQLLKRVVALHVGHILQSTHSNLENIKASLPAHAREIMKTNLARSDMETADTILTCQIGNHQAVTLTIDGVTGRPVISPANAVAAMAQSDLENQKDSANMHMVLMRYLAYDIQDSIYRQAERSGWRLMKLAVNEEDVKSKMGVGVLRHGFYHARGWKATKWYIAYSVTLSGESWWAAEMQVVSDLQGYCDANSANSSYMSDAYRLTECRRLPTKTISGVEPPLSSYHFRNIASFAARAISYWEANKSLVRLNVPSAIRYVLYNQQGNDDSPMEPSNSRTLPALCVRFSSLLKDFTFNDQFAADLLQISYLGFDTDLGAVRLQAKGMMRRPARLREILHRTRNDDLWLDSSGSFSLHLRTGLGTSCVNRLVAQLRTMGRVCNFADVLKQRGLECKKISLSRVVFTYTSDLEMELLFTGIETTPIKLAIKPDNPHRRIGRLLEAVVNDGPNGFKSFTIALGFTLPLLNAFDAIELRHMSSAVSDIPVIHARSPDHFRLCYTNPPCVFEIRMRLTKDKLEWIIQQPTTTAQREERAMNHPTLNGTIMELFKSVGDGWSGMSSMIVTDVNAVGIPLLQLDEAISECTRTEPASDVACDAPNVIMVD